MKKHKIKQWYRLWQSKVHVDDGWMVETMMVTWRLPCLFYVESMFITVNTNSKVQTALKKAIKIKLSLAVA